MVLLIGLTAVAASAQRRGAGFGVRRVYRPIVVRPYYIRHDPFWYGSVWDNPYYYDPYLNERREKYYLEQEVRGDKRELNKHLEKYNADGVITDKERKELDDDYRDVDRAQRKLNKFNSER